MFLFRKKGRHSQQQQTRSSPLALERDEAGRGKRKSDREAFKRLVIVGVLALCIFIFIYHSLTKDGTQKGTFPLHLKKKGESETDSSTPIQREKREERAKREGEREEKKPKQFVVSEKDEILVRKKKQKKLDPQMKKDLHEFWENRGKGEKNRPNILFEEEKEREF